MHGGIASLTRPDDCEQTVASSHTVVCSDPDLGRQLLHGHVYEQFEDTTNGGEIARGKIVQ